MLKRKVSIAKSRPSPLLPPVEDLLGLLELPSNLSDFALDIAGEKNLPLPVDRKTLTFAKSNSVKIATARKIVRFVVGHLPYVEFGENPLTFFNSDFRRLARRVSKYPGNGELWRCLLWGYNKADPSGFPETKAFLRARCVAEFQLFESCKGSESVIEICVEVYSRETLVDKEQIKAALRDISESNDINKKISKISVEFLVRNYFDFYLFLMAYIERDLVDCYISETKDDDQVIMDEGVFRTILPSFDNGKYSVPLGKLLDRWRHGIALKLRQKDQPFGWREFAQFLPDPIRSDLKKSDTCKVRTMNNKYRELAAWRSGVVVPSEEKLRGFIENLLPLCRQREWFFWGAQAAIAMNRLYWKIDQMNVFTGAEIIGFFADYNRYRLAVRSKSPALNRN